MTLTMKQTFLTATATLSLLGACQHQAAVAEISQSADVQEQACQVTQPFSTTDFGPVFEAEMDALMAHMIDRGIAPGGVIRIDQGGQTRFSKAYGLADMETDKPMQADSLFRIYSMTKAITTIAALQLVDDGRLDLDAPIHRYLPDFETVEVLVDAESGETRKPERAPTVRDLMRHTAGLTYRTGAKTGPVAEIYAALGVPAGPGVANPPTNGMDPVVGNDAFVSRIAMAPLEHDPGARFTYGNSTDVLGAVVAQVAGQPLSEFMAENIFAPLGMTDSGFQLPANRADDFTSAYIVPSQTPPGTSVDNPTPIDALEPQTPTRLDPYFASFYAQTPDFEYGGAGLISDADDYLAFTNALMDDSDRLISDTLWNEARRDQLPLPAKSQDAFLGKRGFGLGFAIRESETHASTTFPQCGLFWAGAASTYFWIDPETQTTGVLMTQVFESDVRSYFQEILTHVYPE